MPFEQKTPFYHSQPPQNTIVLFVFWDFPFPFVLLFLFCFLQHKDKNKKCTLFFRMPFFDIPTTCQKTFSHPYTLFVILNYPPNLSNWGTWSKKHLGQIFDSTLARLLTQKRPNLGQIWDSKAHAFIYACWTDSPLSTFTPKQSESTIHLYPNPSKKNIKNNHKHKGNELLSLWSIIES